MEIMFKCFGKLGKPVPCPYEDSCKTMKIDATTCGDIPFRVVIADCTGECKRDEEAQNHL